MPDDTTTTAESLARLEDFFQSKSQTDDLDDGEIEMIEEMLAKAYSNSQVDQPPKEVVSCWSQDDEPFDYSQKAYDPLEALRMYREQYGMDVKTSASPITLRKAPKASTAGLLSTMTSQQIFGPALQQLEEDKVRKAMEKAIREESKREEEMTPKSDDGPVKVVTKTANAIMSILGAPQRIDAPTPKTFKPVIPDTITIPSVVVTPLETAPLPSIKSAQIDLTIEPFEPVRPVEPVELVDAEPISLVEPEAKSDQVPLVAKIQAPFVFNGHVESEATAKRVRTFNPLSPMLEPESPSIRQAIRAPVVTSQLKSTPITPVIMTPNDAAKAIPENDLPVYSFDPILGLHMPRYNAKIEEAKLLHVDSLPRFTF